MASSYWLSSKPLVLASGSTSRSQLLRSAGLPHAVMPAEIDERVIEQSLPLGNDSSVATALAREKAKFVARNNPGSIVLGADQTLMLGNDRFHKPETIDQARSQLTKLRGKTHELNSAVAVVSDRDLLFETVDVARLTVRSFSDAFLDDYLARTGKPILSSVGCYHVEAQGIQLFDRIEGDQFTIMGLPLLPLLKFLREAGLVRS